MIIEGKTKRIEPMTVALVTSKDDITAGDGARHDILVGKAHLATRTTCNIFELLQRQGIPLAYIGRGGPRTFYAQLCEMIPIEVVVRYVAMGSYCKRNPETKPGELLQTPIVEFYLKTSGKQFRGFKLPCDDPLLQPIKDKGWHLYRPNLPVTTGYIEPLYLTRNEQSKLTCRLNTCHSVALQVGEILRTAWAGQSGLLQDFKLEFGVLAGERIVVADVIDCDSWRVLHDGTQLSKQGYREDASLEVVLETYTLAALLTDNMLR